MIGQSWLLLMSGLRPVDVPQVSTEQRGWVESCWIQRGIDVLRDARARDRDVENIRFVQKAKRGYVGFHVGGQREIHNVTLFALKRVGRANENLMFVVCFERKLLRQLLRDVIHLTSERRKNPDRMTGFWAESALLFDLTRRVCE